MGAFCSLGTLAMSGHIVDVTTWWGGGCHQHGEERTGAVDPHSTQDAPPQSSPAQRHSSGQAEKPA